MHFRCLLLEINNFLPFRKVVREEELWVVAYPSCSMKRSVRSIPPMSKSRLILRRLLYFQGYMTALAAAIPDLILYLENTPNFVLFLQLHQSSRPASPRFSRLSTRLVQQILEHWPPTYGNSYPLSGLHQKEKPWSRPRFRTGAVYCSSTGIMYPFQGLP